MGQKWMRWLLVAAALILALAGCGGGSAQLGQPLASEASGSPADGGGQSGYPLVVTDGSGNEVVIEKRPERIVSVTLGTDEILLSLVDKSRLVAVTQLSTDPVISNVAGQTDDIPVKIVNSNAEQIIGLQPDLVFVASYTTPDVVQQLRDAGCAVYLFNAVNSIEEMQENILAIGKVVGETEKAERLVADMDVRLTAIAEKVAQVAERPTVLGYSPDGYTGGKGTSNDDIITRAGGRNLAAEAGLEGWQPISLEKIVELNPDVILLSDWNPEDAEFAKTLQNNPALAQVTAVRENRVVSVPGKHLTSVAQYVVDGVEDVYRVLHP